MPIPTEIIPTLLSSLNITSIPDGDNQPRSTDGPGSTLLLVPDATTSVKNEPVVTIDDLNANFAALGKAQADGDAPVVDVIADKAFVAVLGDGQLKGEQDGVVVQGDDAIVLNVGSIFGGVNGVCFLGDNGFLSNFGSIKSDSRAVDIVGTDTAILNFGSITGTGDQRNGTVYADNEAENILIANAEGGVIDAGAGNNGAGISLELGDYAGEAVAAVIGNAGRIVGRGEAPEGNNTNGDGVRLFSGDDGGTFFAGEFVNEGNIISNSARGVEISDGLGFLGNFVNSGRIFGETDGLYFGNAQHEAYVVNTGVIASDSRAVNIDGTGVVLQNYGRIVGQDDQRNGTVYADSTAEDYLIYNAESGVINAGRSNDGSGVSLQTGESDGDVVSASLVNHGLIRGQGDATTGNEIGDGVRLFSSVDHTVFQGDLVNTGRIIATDDSNAAVGIRIEDGVALNGTIVNDGRIVANDVAIDASEAGGHVDVLNNGVILGNVLLSAGDDTFDGSHGRVNGVVKGGAGDDTLIGGKRSDTLEGGGDDDTLTGNEGADVFVFTEKSVPSDDVITDFEDGVDKIDVTDFDFHNWTTEAVPQDNGSAIAAEEVPISPEVAASSIEEPGDLPDLIIGFIEADQRGDDVLLTFDENNTALLQDLSLSQLSVDDFLF